MWYELESYEHRSRISCMLRSTPVFVKECSSLILSLSDTSSHTSSRTMLSVTHIPYMSEEIQPGRPWQEFTSTDQCNILLRLKFTLLKGLLPFWQVRTYWLFYSICRSSRSLSPRLSIEWHWESQSSFWPPPYSNTGLKHCIATHFWLIVCRYRVTVHLNISVHLLWHELHVEH